MKLRILAVYWHIFVLTSHLLSSIELLTIYAIYVLTVHMYVLLVCMCVWAGGEGAYLILCELLKIVNLLALNEPQSVGYTRSQ